MTDRVLRSFLLGAREDADWVNANSTILRVVPDPRSGEPPCVYLGLLREVEHLRRASGGSVEVSSDPIPFTVRFPLDYLVSSDPMLQLRIVELGAPVFAVNVRGPLVCMGSRFQPGARLRTLMEHVWGILSCRVYNTSDAFNAEARDYFYRNADQVRALRAAPLWARSIAKSAVVQSMNAEPGAGSGGQP